MLNVKAMVLNALNELKAREINTLDVQDLTDITDCMIIATGTSTTHVRALADSIIRTVKQNDYEPLGVEGEKDASWILIDLGDLVVHVMLPQTRQFYCLEKLWTKIEPMVSIA